MLRKCVAYLLAGLFLTGSIFLPYSDFSLVKDIPVMYRAYEKIADPDEIGIADFIGDYLLSGKILLGHNKSDKQETHNNSVQFQHLPDSSGFVNFKYDNIEFVFYSTFICHYISTELIEMKEFHPELFRPPLAA